MKFVSRLAAITCVALTLVPAPAALAEPVLKFEITPRIALERVTLPAGAPTRHQFLFTLDQPLEPGQTVTVDVMSSTRQAISQFNLFSIAVEGMQFPQDADPAGDFTTLRYVLEAQESLVNIEFFTDQLDDDGDGGGGTSNTDCDVTTGVGCAGPPEVTFTVVNCDGCVVDPDFQAVDMFFYDDPTDLPRTIDFRATPRILAESPGDVLDLEFLVFQSLPPEGITLAVEAGGPLSFEDFDVDAATASPDSTFAANAFLSGFTLQLMPQSEMFGFGGDYRVSIPVFRDSLDGEGCETFSLTLSADGGYTPTTSAADGRQVAIRDTEDVPEESCVFDDDQPPGGGDIPNFSSRSDGVGATSITLLLLLLCMLLPTYGRRLLADRRTSR